MNGRPSRLMDEEKDDRHRIKIRGHMTGLISVVIEKVLQCKRTCNKLSVKLETLDFISR